MADKTTLAESAQALFCALADYLQLKGVKLETMFDLDEYPTYAAFELIWNKEYDYKINDVFKKHIETPKITLNDLEKFLTDNLDWYKSSVLIAKKLVEDIDKVVKGFKGIKKPKAAEIWFVRGDNSVMKNIETLFKKANETQKKMNKVEAIGGRGIVFGDINKWSPADIYFASDLARDKIQKEVDNNPENSGYIFSSLNILIANLIAKGELLPLSLKKQTKQVVLQKVNFDRQEELKVIEKFEYNGTSDWKQYKVNQPQTRDMKIFFNPSSPKDYIKIKHDVSTAAFKAEVVYSGAESKAGSIGSIGIFSDIVKIIDPQFAGSYKRTFDAGNKAFKDEMEKWEKKYGKKPAGPKKGQKATPLREQYEYDRGVTSALNVINKIMPPMITWLNKDKSRAGNFVRLIYEYSTSRTQDSGRFVIAK
jgi:hypothetical protein